jgi:hypothetical protein
MSLMVVLPTTPALVVESVRVTLPWDKMSISPREIRRECLPGQR